MSRLLLAALLCSWPGGMVVGQAIPGDPGISDETNQIEAGRVAGAAAAGEPIIAEYRIAGFLGGFVAGLTIPFAIASPRSPALLAGLGGLYAASASANYAVNARTDLPAGLAAEIATAPQPYQNAFRESYDQRLRQRRIRASWWSVPFGVAAGIGTLVYIASGIDF